MDSNKHTCFGFDSAEALFKAALHLQPCRHRSGVYFYKNHKGNRNDLEITEWRMFSSGHFLARMKQASYYRNQAGG